MSTKNQKIGFVVLLVIISVCLVLKYMVGSENFEDPIMAEYLVEVVLYPAVIAEIVLLWKLTLDNKIRSKEERNSDVNNMNS